MKPVTEYGIASASNPAIESLGQIGRVQADAIVADSRTVWPDVYLVTRTDDTDWHSASEIHTV